MRALPARVARSLGQMLGVLIIIRSAICQMCALASQQHHTFVHSASINKVQSAPAMMKPAVLGSRTPALPSHRCRIAMRALPIARRTSQLTRLPGKRQLTARSALVTDKIKESVQQVCIIFQVR